MASPDFNLERGALDSKDDSNASGNQELPTSRWQFLPIATNFSIVPGLQVDNSGGRFALRTPGHFAMMARLLFVMHVVALLAGAGCCCQPLCGDACGGPACGPACNTCCLCLPKPIVWNGACNDCGPGPCESCADCPTDCGILPWLRRSKVCGKGCGEVYWGEWISDPPDCCDPCDPCYGCYTGPNDGCCNLGPCQRLLAALHGYKYCPAPCCGDVCGLCNKGTCGGCGDAGCTSCGHSPHGADVYYDGPVESHGNIHGPSQHMHGHGESIMNENWDQPKTKPIPGKPIHKAQQPRGQYTQRGAMPTGRQQSNMQPAAMRPGQSRPTMSERATSGRGAFPAGVRQVSRNSEPVGTGVRPAAYQR
jgi:hypothetical protein